VRPLDLGPAEVEVLAQVEGGPHKDFDAPVQLLQYKVGKLLRLSGGDPHAITAMNLELHAQVGAKKTALRPIASNEFAQAFITAPEAGAICGGRATTVTEVEVNDYPEMVKHEPRCAEHA